MEGKRLGAIEWHVVRALERALTMGLEGGFHRVLDRGLYRRSPTHLVEEATSRGIIWPRQGSRQGPRQRPRRGA